ERVISAAWKGPDAARRNSDARERGPSRPGERGLVLGHQNSSGLHPVLSQPPRLPAPVRFHTPDRRTRPPPWGGRRCPTSPPPGEPGGDVRGGGSRGGSRRPLRGPAVSVPMGIGAERLPLGIQFVGSAGERNRMLAGVSGYQSRTRRRLERGPAGDLGG